jgi:hypothetical protein
MWGALWSVAGRNKTSLAFTPQKRIYFRELRVYFFSQLQYGDLGAELFLGARASTCTPFLWVM